MCNFCTQFAVTMYNVLISQSSAVECELLFEFAHVGEKRLIRLIFENSKCAFVNHRYEK